MCLKSPVRKRERQILVMVTEIVTETRCVEWRCGFMRGDILDERGMRKGICPVNTKEGFNGLSRNYTR